MIRRLSAAAAQRDSLQMLLVGVVCEGILGLLHGRGVVNPALCSLRLACWASYAALSGLKKTQEERPQTHESASLKLTRITNLHF